MDTEKEAYIKGEEHGMEVSTGISTASPMIANPYDSYTNPELSYAFESGFNNYIRNMLKKRDEDGSWYSDNEP